MSTVLHIQGRRISFDQVCALHALKFYDEVDTPYSIGMFEAQKIVSLKKFLLYYGSLKRSVDSNKIRHKTFASIQWKRLPETSGFSRNAFPINLGGSS